ncbi:mannitol dehydrogenase family protein [Pseudonocardia sp. HH130630-07]|uniref:mannitol dehydrogenase family protein n=1 Tax=Pseudonocardia sp. HH130630-07 TaxID=1690815 RepID=UPI000814CC56|nr:mannitol dehydrogenase family protein [Pseudonocardia sp. HH130630-07]ANY07118.1 hypothetical protein AFB00_13405 [Pseudonocardia sp. HH130630-07]
MPADLSAATLARVPERMRPRARPGGAATAAGAGAAPGIVHLGPGAFHRAHQAVHTEDATAASGDDRWGILGVAPRSTGVVDRLAAQDCLYSLTEAGARGRSTRVVGALTATLALTRDRPEVVAAIASPHTRIVTLTITEDGYTGGDAVTVLADGLLARLAAGATPVALVSCDNVRNRDQVLRRAVDAAAARLEPGRRRALAEFVAGAVTFPGSVVDRITPAATDRDAALASAALGVRDAAAVVTEPYSSWVLTDDFPGGRPRWEDAGVTFAADVEPFERLKLRVLNAAHSALAYLGGPAGHRTIAAAAGDPRLLALVRRMVHDEVAPALAAHGTPVADTRHYLDTVLGRFANPHLPHTTAQVARDGSRKLPVRILDTITELRRAGTMPDAATSVVAAWIRTVRNPVSDDGGPLAVVDPLLSRGVLADPGRATAAEFLRLLTADGDGALAADEEFLALLDARVRELDRHGTAAVLG